MICFCCLSPLSIFLTVLLFVWLGKHGFFDEPADKTEE